MTGEFGCLIETIPIWGKYFPEENPRHVLAVKRLGRLTEIRGKSFFRRIFGKSGQKPVGADNGSKTSAPGNGNADGKQNLLTEYRYSSSGSMTGGHHTETVKPLDEKHAVVRIEHAEWHNEKPEVREHTVDAAIMGELDTVIRKHKMDRWNGKKFTDTFVCDGASYSYSFSYSDSFINFSSQLYPGKYGEALAELHDVVKKYLPSEK